MIDFSTLQGLTIPEGVVTQIADASGRVLWSAAPKIRFVPIVDLGTVTTMNMGSIHAANITLNSLPNGYNTCTHVMVDNVLYEVTTTSITNGVSYSPTNTSVLAQIQVLTTKKATCFFNVAGTYTVQLGLGIPEGSVRVSFPSGTYAEGPYVDGKSNYVECFADENEGSLDSVGTWAGNDLIVPAGTTLYLAVRGTYSYNQVVTIYGEYNSVTSETTIPFIVTQDTTVNLYEQGADIRITET